VKKPQTPSPISVDLRAGFAPYRGKTSCSSGLSFLWERTVYDIDDSGCGLLPAGGSCVASPAGMSKESARPVQSSQKEGSASSQTAKPPATPAQLQGDPTKGMIRVPAGEFVFGATEKTVSAFLAAMYVNYPGMKEKLRKLFVIPPREVNLPISISTSSK